MVCPNCGSNNITVQIINKQSIENVHHSFAWWLLIGWWLIAIKWLFLTPIAIFTFILKLCGVRKKKIVNKFEPVKICQNCGSTFQ